MPDKSVVIPLQGGGKVAVPINIVSGDKSVVLSIQGGSKVAVPLSNLSVGSKVVVVKLQDGSKSALSLNQIVHRDGYGEIWIHLGIVPAGPYQFVSMEYYAVTNMVGGWGSYIYSLDGVETVLNFELNSPHSWGLVVKSSTYFGSFEVDHDVWVGFRMNISPGSYYRIDNIKFRDFGFHANQLYPDGSFESGGFGDGETQWTGTGDVRIINTDSYDGDYCVEFFGP